MFMRGGSRVLMVEHGEGGVASAAAVRLVISVGRGREQSLVMCRRAPEIVSTGHTTGRADSHRARELRVQLE